MLTAALLTVMLCAAPSKAAPVPPPAPKAATYKLAAPGLSAVNVSTDLQTFINDHLNQELMLDGIEVLSASQIAAVVGFERQKQLIGCSETSGSCLTELANALGVDALVLGNVGKFGTTMQLDVRVVGAGDAKTLAITSLKVADEAGLPDALTRVANEVSSQLQTSLHRTFVSRRSSAPAVSLAPAFGPAVKTVTRETSLRAAGRWTALSGLGLLVAGLVIVGVTTEYDVAAAGAIVAIAGAAGGIIGGVLWLVGGTEQVPVTGALLPTRDGWRFALTAHW